MLRRAALGLAAAILIAPALAQNSREKIRSDPSDDAAKAGTRVPWRTSLDDALGEARRSGKPVFWYVPTVVGSPMDRQVELDRYMMAGPFSWSAVVGLLGERFVPLRAVPSRSEQERYGLGPGGFVEPGYVVLDADGEERTRLDEITTFHEAWFVRRLLEGLPDAAEVEIDVAADPEIARWKAAAEAEGHGPVRYGFEIPFELPEAVLEARPVHGTRAPAGAYDAAAVRRSAVRFFAWMQREDGRFDDSRYDYGGTDSLPNVWVAVTALAGRAMLDVVPRLTDEEAREQATRIAERAFDHVRDDSHLALDDRDELAWALIYRARFAADWLAGRADRGDEARALLRASVERLLEMQQSDGAWFHEYANPFVTASVLLAIAEARDRIEGFAPDPDALARGFGALRRCITSDEAVTYADSRRGRARAALAGSVGRMPVVQHALARFDAGAEGALLRAVERAFEFHDEMDAVRKYDDHAGRFGYGGFFFWYGMHGRAEAIAALADGEAKEQLAARLREQVMALPEIDGCFVDSHEIGRVYGTAMAILCLARTEPR